MPQEVVSLRLAVVIVGSLGVGLLASPAALAADPPPQRNADRAHPEAEKINQANPRVKHAGPGVPLTGSVFLPPSVEKSKKK